MSEICPTCGAEIKRQTVLPAAEQLNIQFDEDRDLYAIGGKAGLWFWGRMRDDPDAEMCYARPTHGDCCEAIFFRATEAEDRIRKALGIEVKP